MSSHFATDFVVTEAGWLQPACHQRSPNQDARPHADDLSLIVLHGISLPAGQFGGVWIDQLFMNTLPADLPPELAALSGLRVSAHLLIRRDGGVTQYVSFQQRAWHAGLSEYRGRPRCNDFSIGIELEGTDHIPYTDAQYAVLAAVIAALCQHYPNLSADHLVGHSDIAPTRKTDPGPAFDWARLRMLLSAYHIKSSGTA